LEGKPAVGFWQGITSTESQVYQYHIGISAGREEGRLEEE
jgi:hypothetical protein